MMESNTSRDYKARIIRVLIYIDEHIDEELDFKRLARVASFSAFHFHRIFRAFVGEPVHHYVRRLRLERAAGQLRYGDEEITKIALDAGYETPSAFTRAFSQVMGCSPQAYRKQRRQSSYLSEAIRHVEERATKESIMLRPEMMKMDPLSVLFVRGTGDYSVAGQKAWTRLKQWLGDQGVDEKALRFFGLPHDDPDITEEDKLRYDACVVAKGLKPEGEVGQQTIGGGKYARFVHKGSYEGLEKTFDEIFGHWYPNSGVEVKEAPCMMEFVEMHKAESDPDRLLTYIYVPIK